MEYSKIFDIYDLWVCSDEAYQASEDFYVNFLKDAGYSIAELGVGTGRIALRLIQQFDKHVIGIDRCPEMLDSCRAKFNAMTCRGSLELTNADFLRFSLDEPVDCIYIPFRTIGHVMSDDDMLSFLLNVRANLKKGGRFVFDHDVFDPIRAEEDTGRDILVYQDDEVRIEENATYDFTTHIVRCAVKCDGVVLETIAYRELDMLKTLELVNRSGFTIEKICRGFDLDEYWTKDSKTQIVWILRNNG